jgi:hypothetical protein
MARIALLNKKSLARQIGDTTNKETWEKKEGSKSWGSKTPHPYQTMESSEFSISSNTAGLPLMTAKQFKEFCGKRRNTVIITDLTLQAQFV